MTLAKPQTPTVELLLRCARSNTASAGNADSIRSLIAAGVDGGQLFELAQSQHVTPLVWTSLSAISPGALPPAVAASFEAEVRRNTIYNLYLTRRLVRLINQLAAAGIPALAYKGPLLAVQAYGQLSARQFADLDLLVHLEHIAAARDVLLADGFRQTWPAGPLSPGQQAQHLRTKYNIGLLHSDDQLNLELHWGLTPNYLRIPPDNAELWQGLDEVTLAGQRLAAFAPARLLLIVCVHAANHCWLHLNWVCDVAELVRRHPALDWPALMEEARRWGCQRILHLGLILAAELLDLELPARVQQALAGDAGAQRLAAQVAQRLTRYPSYWLRPFEEPLFHLRMRERPADRLRYGLGMLTPTAKDWTYLPLPDWLAPLYYVVRPARLIIDHGLRLRAAADQ